MKRLLLLLLLSLCPLSPSLLHAQRGFAIIVDPKSYEEAREELAKYAQTIEELQGLRVYTVIDRWGIPDSIRVELMRLHALQDHPIEGAVFVGDIPIAMIRDAQHLTSAFKMNQTLYPRKESSVPSDRFYDDFGLRFTFLDKDTDAPYFYYSLTPESDQRLKPDLYTGRIRPTDSGGISRYEKLRKYLTKAVDEKKRLGALRQVLIFGGHGYISESMVARMDEKIALFEHFPWLKQPRSSISFIDHSQEDCIKYRLMNELMRPDLDYAILHHHGDWDTQYLSGIPSAPNAEKAKALIQSYGRNMIRNAKRKNKSTDSTLIKLEKRFDVPKSWFADTFEPKVESRDSLAAADLNLQLADFAAHRYTPNARVVAIDACYCGSFHREDCIANEYIFSPGRTVVCIANTVNVLQDKWADRYIGLLGLGMPVGDVARYASYLEAHTIGDPTFTFAPTTKDFDLRFGTLLATATPETWHRLLGHIELPDVQCMAIRRLVDADAIDSHELLHLVRTAPSGIVRLEALVALSEIRGDDFIEAIRIAVDDSHEMTQRFAIRYLGQSGDPRLIPTLIRICITNNTSERTNFNALNALTLYPADTLLAEFDRQFDSPDLHYIDKPKVRATIREAIQKSATRWVDDVRAISDPKTSDKKRKSYIRTLRNYTPHYLVPELLSYLTTCGKPDTQVMLLEALGWHRRSYMAPRIAEVARTMSQARELPEEVRAEALKTYNRLK